jgi:hypothetical protein
MAILVKIKDLVDALEMQNEESAAFLDRETGEVHVVSDETMRIAEHDSAGHDALAEWEQVEVELARRILDNDRYIGLPTSWDVHEWGIMEAFCDTLDDGEARDECVDAIHGRGAFRTFKRVLSRFELSDVWHAFRGDALQKIATDWCEENDIAFEA